MIGRREVNPKKKLCLSPELGDHFHHPRLAIPCWVAPQQSPTPFHQIVAYIVRQVASRFEKFQLPTGEKSATFHV